MSFFNQFKINIQRKYFLLLNVMIYYNSSFFNIGIHSDVCLFEHANSESSSTHDPEIAYIYS